jgi:hypothetical protein
MAKRLYPPLRPQSVSEVLDAAFHIYSASLLKVLPFGILMILAGQLMNIYSLATGRPLRSHPHDAPSGLVYGVSLIAVTTIWAAMMLHQRAIVQAEPTSLRAELARALRALPGIVPLVILMAVALIVGIALLVVPGVYLFVALSMAMPALVLEHKGPIAAMKFSLHLIRGLWWRTLGIFLITAVIVIVFYFLAAILVVVAVQFIRGADVALTTAAATVLIIALGAFSAPYGTATVLAVFGDLRVRDAAAADGHSEY